MSTSFSRKITKTPGSKRKSQSLSKRQTGTLFETIKKDVKSHVKDSDYADYIKKIENWTLTNPTQEECSSTNFMENAEGALIFTRDLAITEKKIEGYPFTKMSHFRQWVVKKLCSG